MKKAFLIFIFNTIIILNLFSVYHKVGEVVTNTFHPLFEISDNIAIANEDDYGIVIYEINNPISPIPISSLEIESTIREIIVIDDLVYLLTSMSKMYIINIQDSYSPFILSEYITSEQGDDFSINNNFAYVVEDNEKLEVVYIGDPENPSFVEQFNLTNQGIACETTNDLAFVCTYLGLFIYDISNPYELNEISWFDTGNTHSPRIQDDLFYCSGRNGITIIDFSDHSNIQLLSETSSYRYFDCEIVDDIFYCISSYRLLSYNISDPLSVYQINDFISKNGGSNIAVIDNHVIKSDTNSGYSIIDVSEPQNNNLLEYNHLKANMLEKSPNEEYMLVYGHSYDGLHFYDMTDSLNPFYMYSHISQGGTSGCQAFYIDDDICCSNFGTNLYIYDLSDPIFLAIPGIINLTYNGSSTAVRSIARKDDYLYLGCLTEGVIIVDISDPDNPEQVATYDMQGWVQNIKIEGDFLYLANGNGLQIYDITNPLYPTVRGFWDSNYSMYNFVLFEDFAYIADNIGGLKVINISNPDNPILVNTLVLHGTSKLDVDPIIRNGRLFVSDRVWNEIFVFDLVDPQNPNLQFSNKWDHYSNDLEVFGNYIFSANGADMYTTYGLSLLDFSEYFTDSEDFYVLESANIANLSNFPNPFNPSTTIKFSVQNDSNINLSIYNIKGQKIKTLANNEFTKGNHSIIWNGDDFSGKAVSSGIYFYKLNVNGKTEIIKKCLLLK